MTICHLSLSGVSGQFIGITGAIGSNDSGSRGNNDGGCIFLFWVLLGNGVLVTTGDLDRLRRL